MALPEISKKRRLFATMISNLIPVKSVRKALRGILILGGKKI